METKVLKLEKELLSLMQSIEADYGSVLNCPEKDKRLVKLHDLTSNNKQSYECPPELASDKEITTIPSRVTVDENMKEIHVRKDFKDVYDNALNKGLTLRRAAEDLGIDSKSIQSLFYGPKIPERYQHVMEFDGHVIRTKLAKGVIAQAKALGFHGTIDKAVRYFKLRREVKIAPVVFNYGKDNEYSWKY